MTGLCLDCNQPAHVGLSCAGFPLMLLDDVDEPECPLCHDPRCESERVCATCLAEGRAFARVVMPALDELMWRRQLNAEPRTVVVDLAADAEHDEWCDAGCEARGHVYEYVARVGTLAALGLALGSLAPLAAMLGGMS